MDYDLSMLKKLAGDDERFIIDMLITFKRTAPPIVERMIRYESEHKYAALGKEAHKLIPGVSFLGASILKQELIHVEEGVKNNTSPDEMHQRVMNVSKLVESLIRRFDADFYLE